MNKKGVGEPFVMSYSWIAMGIVLLVFLIIFGVTKCAEQMGVLDESESSYLPIDEKSSDVITSTMRPHVITIMSSSFKTCGGDIIDPNSELFSNLSAIDATLLDLFVFNDTKFQACFNKLFNNKKIIYYANYRLYSNVLNYSVETNYQCNGDKIHLGRYFLPYFRYQGRYVLYVEVCYIP